MSSGPVALPFFILFTAFVTSARVTRGTCPWGRSCELVDAAIPHLRWLLNTRSNGRVRREGHAILAPHHSSCVSVDQWLGLICAASTQLSPWPLPISQPSRVSNCLGGGSPGVCDAIACTPTSWP